MFTETRLKGAFIIELERREDERGFFARGLCPTENLKSMSNESRPLQRYERQRSSTARPVPGNTAFNVQSAIDVGTETPPDSTCGHDGTLRMLGTQGLRQPRAATRPDPSPGSLVSRTRSNRRIDARLQSSNEASTRCYAPGR